MHYLTAGVPIFFTITVHFKSDMNSVCQDCMGAVWMHHHPTSLLNSPKMYHLNCIREEGRLGEG